MSEDEAFNAIVHLLLDENTTVGVRDILRAYGDARERAGLERAAGYCADKANDYSRFSDMHELCTGLANEIRHDLIGPAPDAGEKEPKNAES